MTEGAMTDAGTLLPVHFIPDDPELDRPEEGMALCLSGGGFRAMLFHTGALWRLNELGFLPILKRISSVSGGSIIGADQDVRYKRGVKQGGLRHGASTLWPRPK